MTLKNTRLFAIKGNRKVKISAKKIRDNDLLERLRFAYAVAPRDTVRVFRKLGIVITNENDLTKIVQLHESGQAEHGYTSQDGRTYAFNLEEILTRKPDQKNSIKVSAKMVQVAPIEWLDIIREGDFVKVIS